MYLTQLQLDPRSAQARRDLGDPYDMHRTLVRAFVNDERDTPPRFLWRLESGRSWDRPTVLVQSLQAPDWSFLQALAGYLGEAAPPTTKSFEPANLLQPDRRCRFRLAANPTVTREGKRHGLVGEVAQLAWLGRQAARCGFTLLGAGVSGSNSLQGRKAATRVSLLQVQFDGVLQVIDAGAVARAVADGIGPGKAFGCGLLSLAPCS